MWHAIVCGQSIMNYVLDHGAEGWTTLRAVAHDACTDAICCVRHPRAAGCNGARSTPAARTPQSASISLHEDLFLRDGQRTGDAPKVVRAYEACSAQEDVAAHIKHERNATRAARAALLTHPLPVVGIIFFGTHLERLALVRSAYEPYFHSLVFMSPSAAITQAGLPGRSDRAGSLRRHVYHHCRKGLKCTYACVADVAIAAGSAPGVQGVLYFHFDMWLHPWSLLRPSTLSANPMGGETTATMLDSLWALPAGRIMIKAPGPTRLLPLECFDARNDSEYRHLYLTKIARGRHIPGWTWERDVPTALAALRGACAGGRCSRHELCIGWADLYYVPRRLYPAFVELSRTFGATSANAELAVPTMLSILSRRSRRDRTAHVHALHRLPCWGFCCSTTSCPELLARHRCGHRMRLELPRVRTAFERLLRATSD
jgi:hypothetical protein